MRSARIALAGGLLLMALALGVTLAHAPLVVAGTDEVATGEHVELERGDVGDCQRAGTLPQGTTAIRLALETIAVGPRVKVKALSGTRVVTEGERAAGWGIAQSVTIPVRRVARAEPDAVLCTSVGPTVEPFRVRGTLVRQSATGGHSLGEIEVAAEYLRPGSSSWLSLASAVANHMGVGNATHGAWIAFLVLALMLATIALVSLQALRELG
jgi:hypothetical protein